MAWPVRSPLLRGGRQRSSWLRGAVGLSGGSTRCLSSETSSKATVRHSHSCRGTMLQLQRPRGCGVTSKTAFQRFLPGSSPACPKCSPQSGYQAAQGAKPRSADSSMTGSVWE
eukprot:2564237-Lingulodinium_polyedra.AAC.1